MIVPSYEKILVLEININTKFLQFRMKHIIDAGFSSDY